MPDVLRMDSDYCVSLCALKERTSHIAAAAISSQRTNEQGGDHAYRVSVHFLLVDFAATQNYDGSFSFPRWRRARRVPALGFLYSLSFNILLNKGCLKEVTASRYFRDLLRGSRDAEKSIQARAVAHTLCLDATSGCSAKAIRDGRDTWLATSSPKPQTLVARVSFLGEGP
jgi:hypothetical protein